MKLTFIVCSLKQWQSKSHNPDRINWMLQFIGSSHILSSVYTPFSTKETKIETSISQELEVLLNSQMPFQILKKYVSTWKRFINIFILERVATLWAATWALGTNSEEKYIPSSKSCYGIVLSSLYFNCSASIALTNL